MPNRSAYRDQTCPRCTSKRPRQRLGTLILSARQRELNIRPTGIVDEPAATHAVCTLVSWLFAEEPGPRNRNPAYAFVAFVPFVVFASFVSFVLFVPFVPCSLVEHVATI